VAFALEQALNGRQRLLLVVDDQNGVPGRVANGGLL
jgi:hypothetical protein